MTEDGLRGPVGERFAQALAIAGQRLEIDVRGLDRVTDVVAAYAETNDAALTARLGRAEGVTGWRAFETAFVIFVIDSIVAIIAGVFVLTALF